MSYSSVLQSYDERRAKNARIYEERLRRCEEECPELKELNSALLDAQLDSLAAVLLDSPAPDASLLENRRREMLFDHGFASDYLDPIYDCPDCKDTGFLDSGRSKRCHCLEHLLIYDECRRMGIPDDVSFAAFDGELYPMAAKVYEYCKGLAENYPDPVVSTVVLTGTTGVGKTYAARCFVRALIERGVRVEYLSAYSLFERFHAHRLGEGDIDIFFDVPVLVIDDLGSEPMTRNVTVEYFYNLINTRYERGSLTFLVTNMTPLELKERYGERTSSRILDVASSSIRKLEGDDLRVHR